MVETANGKLDVGKVLDLVNAARVARGDPPLEDLPVEATPEQSDSCVIAQALNIEVSAEVDYDFVSFGNAEAAEAAGRAWKRTPKRSTNDPYDETSTNMPRVLSKFAQAFDNGTLVRTHPHLYGTAWLIDAMEDALSMSSWDDADKFAKALEGRGVDAEVAEIRKSYE